MAVLGLFLPSLGAGAFAPCLRLFQGQCFKKRGPVPNLGICSSSSRSEDNLITKENSEQISIKREKLDVNTRRAARKAVATVLQVDRARLLDVDGISRKSARLLPRAILEALTDRIRARKWESALKVSSQTL